PASARRRRRTTDELRKERRPLRGAESNSQSSHLRPLLPVDRDELEPRTNTTMPFPSAPLSLPRNFVRDLYATCDDSFCWFSRDQLKFGRQVAGSTCQ